MCVQIGQNKITTSARLHYHRAESVHSAARALCDYSVLLHSVSSLHSASSLHCLAAAPQMPIQRHGRHFRPAKPTPSERRPLAVHGHWFLLAGPTRWLASANRTELGLLSECGRSLGWARAWARLSRHHLPLMIRLICRADAPSPSLSRSPTRRRAFQISSWGRLGGPIGGQQKGSKGAKEERERGGKSGQLGGLACGLALPIGGQIGGRQASQRTNQRVRVRKSLPARDR